MTCRTRSVRTDEQLVANRLLDRLGEWSLVTRSGVRVLLFVVSTGRDVKHVDALLGENTCNLDRVLGSPALLDFTDFLEPISGTDADEEGHVFGNNATNELGKFDQESGSVFEAATILVGPLVRDWGQEAVEQVTMGAN